jgi:hypothetical protein
MGLVDAEISRLRGLADGISPQIDRPVAGAHGTTASSSPAPSIPSESTADAATDRTSPDTAAELRTDAVRSTAVGSTAERTALARLAHRILDRLVQEQDAVRSTRTPVTVRSTRKRPVRKGAVRRTRSTAVRT